MSAPVLKIDTFINRQYVDSISKLFIIFNVIFGINRLSIIGNIKDNFIYASLVYSLTFNCVITVLTIYASITLKSSLVFINSLKYVFCSVVIYKLRESLMKFYKELEKFDKKIGYETKITKSSTQIIIQLSLTTEHGITEPPRRGGGSVIPCSVSLTFILVMILSFIISNECYIKFNMLLLLYFIPIQIMHAMEFYYIAHMMGLLSPRIRMITYHVKLHYLNNNSMAIYDDAFLRFKKEAKKIPEMNMGDFMDLYYYIVKAYDFLNKAVKWELLILLMASIMVSMRIAYKFSLDIIAGKFYVAILLVCGNLVVPEILPIFTVCLYANQVHREVPKLREALSCSLYLNSLEKRNKIAAQAFIGLTEGNDLSFPLFYMFKIDISLPFHFLGLLLTYLIIILQFQKIISSNVA